MRKTTLVVLIVVAWAASTAADEVYLKSGGQLSGRVVSRTSDKVAIDIGAGRIEVPASSVVRIEEGRSALQEYEERAGALAPGDADGWVALGAWADSRGLGTQAREAYHRALAAAPSDPSANEALGNVRLEGRWVSEDESYRARGYVHFEGEWMTPAEHEAILSERAAAASREHERRESERRVREAEARADEAEARAKEAEAQQAEGIPLWYGWAPGPAYWPSGPVITHPIVPPGAVAPPRPVAPPKPVSPPRPVPVPRPVPR